MDPENPENELPETGEQPEGEGRTNIGNIEKIENIENIERVVVRKSLLDYLPYLSAIIIGLIVLMVLGGIGYMLFKSQVNFFTNGDAVVARGLITFLVAIVTIAIAIILTLSAVLSNSPDFEKRFALGKEILTILIGVLGTIIGFYFGSADKTPVVNVNAANSTAQTLQISPPFVTAEQVTADKSITITSFVSGGKPPYRYKFTFEPNIVASISGETENGVIQAEIKKPEAAIELDIEVIYQIEATDADNKTSILTKDKAKKFVITK